jgi:hypothetical protein
MKADRTYIIAMMSRSELIKDTDFHVKIHAELYTNEHR